MLKQATNTDVTKGIITKAQGYLVLTTRFYPRFLKKELIDDYISDLAPAKNLLLEFKNYEKRLNHHDLAFSKMNYQQKFKINKNGLLQLQALTEFSKKQDVYLLCYCEKGQCCHRELLLLMAQHHFGAEIEPLSHPYDVFRFRLKTGT